MKCLGVSCVRNEADILELWARHNLNLVDELHVIDHLSIDRSRWVLEQLRAEGLPVFLYAATDPGHHQPQLLTALARRLAPEREADYLVPLDADELLAAPDRAAFHQALSAIPAGRGGALYWQTFLPEPPATDPTLPFFQRMRRYRQHELRTMTKVVLRGDGCPAYAWSPGCHQAFDAAGQPLETVILPFRLGHYPVRNADQLARKVLTGAVARALKPQRQPGEGQHWDRVLAELRDSGYRPEALDLERIALTYSFPDTPEVQTVLQALALPTFANVIQRYPAEPLSWRAALRDSLRHAADAQSKSDGTGTG